MICTDSFNNQGARDFHRERNTASMTNMPVWRCALNSNKMQVTQVCCLLFFLKYILLIMLLQFSQLYPFIPCPPCTLILSAFPPLSSFQWVVLISFLNFLFPIPFLTSPCPFYAYQLCFFFRVPFPSYCSPSPPPRKPSM